VQELEPADRGHRSGACRRCVVVDEDKELDPFVAGEGLGVTAITRSDRDDPRPEADDLVVAVAQLRGMLAAVQSTEMSKEHQHDRLVAPQITEAV
jgi:hypothetical protein